MNILFLTRRFYPQIGGVETHVLELGKRIIQDGHRLTVITEMKSNLSSAPHSLSSIEGIEIIRINNGKDNWFKKIRIWKELFKQQKLIRNADIVHCHDVFFWYLPFRFIYPLKRVYTTFHGYETKFPPLKKAIFIRKLSKKLSFGNICVGNYIEKWYGTNADFIIYGGVHTAERHTGVNHNMQVNIIFIVMLHADLAVNTY